MGCALREVAAGSGATIVAELGHDDCIDGGSLAGADVAIEFSVPAAAAPNIRACVNAGCPVVVGTTGWYEQLPDITEYVRAHRGAVLWSANFSLGINALARLVSAAGMIFVNMPQFGAAIVETHHAAKLDAPSGTALLLQGEVEATLGRPVPITSVRVGAVPGVHELIIDGGFEQIVLSHRVRDRRVFAEGALTAARWLVGRCGIFTIDDVLQPQQVDTGATRAE